MDVGECSFPRFPVSQGQIVVRPVLLAPRTPAIWVATGLPLGLDRAKAQLPKDV